MNIVSIDQISRERPTYIYGASTYGQKTLQGLLAAGYSNIVGFIDTYRSGVFQGLPVTRFVDYIGGYQEDHQILIASSYYKEIEIRLLSYGVVDYLIDDNQSISEIAPTTYSTSLSAKYIIEGEEEFERDGGWVKKYDRTYCFSLNVWGENFLYLFQSIALPSMLSPNNFPRLAQNDRVRLYLYMRKDEADAFRKTKLFASLRAVLDIILTYIKVPELPADPQAASGVKYGFLYKLYMYFYQTAMGREQDAILGFLSPDMLASDGYLSNAAKRIEEGYRAVYAPEIVVDKARFLALFESRRQDAQALPAGIGARELTGLAFRSLHRAYEIDFVSATPFHRHACRFIWPVPGEGALLHTFHMHHLMVWPRRQVTTFKAGFDHDFLIRALDPEDRIYAPVDSDEMVHVNITPWHADDQTIPQFDVAAMAGFLGELIEYDIQRELLRRPCRLHYTSCSDGVWQSVEAEAKIVIDQLIEAAAQRV